MHRHDIKAWRLCPCTTPLRPIAWKILPGLFGILFSTRKKPPQSAAALRAKGRLSRPDLERGGFSAICAERERARARFLTLRPAVGSVADESLVR